MKPKVAIIVDNLSLSKWQKNALEEAKKKIDIVLILNCKNTKSKKKIFKHFFYYMLNFFSLKHFLAKKSNVNFSNVEIINFYSVYSGIWQTLPRHIIDQFEKKKINLVIKFGMNLLKIENNLKNLNILSFHHGDPSKYRGRPAGFYEILNNEKKICIIVQRLTNKLDAGIILAFAESKIVNFSYRKTSINFYANSKFLLSKAIDNFIEKKEVNINKNGKIYKLPGNLTVLKFIILIFLNLSRKLFYGFFFEKKWKVAVSKNELLFNGNEMISSNYLSEVPLDNKYNFYADPFFSHDNKSIRLEALNKFSGLGELLNVSINNVNEQKLLLSKGHHSYPFSFEYKKKEYLLPEVASHSPQYIMPIDENYEKKIILKGLENERIVDATLIEHEKYWYLFFGMQNNASNVLNLWISSSPFTEFQPHPKTPIVISPKNARMGGSILRSKGNLLRFGQNNEGEYGESLSILQINKLTPKAYSEKSIGCLKMHKYKGPHTLNCNINENLITFDYYENKFSFFAGARRIAGWLNKY